MRPAARTSVAYYARRFFDLSWILNGEAVKLTCGRPDLSNV
jgi:hypothetical protein